MYKYSINTVHINLKMRIKFELCSCLSLGHVVKCEAKGAVIMDHNLNIYY